MIITTIDHFTTLTQCGTAVQSHTRARTTLVGSIRPTRRAQVPSPPGENAQTRPESPPARTQPGNAKRARISRRNPHVGRGPCDWPMRTRPTAAARNSQAPPTPGGGPDTSTPYPDELEPKPEPQGAELEPEVRSQAARVKAVHGAPGGEQWGW